MTLRRILLAAAPLALFGLTAGTCTSSTPPINAALTDAQIAAFAVEGAYTVAAHSEIAAASLMTAAQITAMKAADTTAYNWAKTLAAEAQAANVVAADLAAGQAAVAALQATIKGTTP